MTIDPTWFFARPRTPLVVPLWEMENAFDPPLREEQREELAAALLEAKGEQGWDQIDAAISRLFAAEEDVKHFQRLLAKAQEELAAAEKHLIEASTPVLGFATEEVMGSEGNKARWIDAVHDIFV